MSKFNILMATDSYKHSHYLQLPPGTEYMSSYIEARKGDWNLFFGLQMILPFLQVPTKKQIRRTEALLKQHGLPFNRKGWDDIADLGYLPIRIQAVKEGTILPTGNVMVQLENTDKRFPWLVSFLETMLLRATWYPTTVATNSKAIKNLLIEYLEKSSDNPDTINFMLHDFGFRGVSSDGSGSIGGVAHLVNFMGTDTLGALECADEYYEEPCAGFSVPASEHSTVTSWGRDGEARAYENMINQFSKPNSIYSNVSDSYDIFHAVSNIWGGSLKEKVIVSGGRLVVRPDSGIPHEVVLECVKRLDTAFGHTLNQKGYKVLPDCVRVLQGDGINIHSIKLILDALLAAGYSAENVVFGMGGALLQAVTRDDYSFAMKTNAIKTTDGFWADVVKDPITDSGKRSKGGRLALVYDKTTGYRTVREHEATPATNLLETVFLNGKIVRNQRLSEIRTIANR